MSEPTPVPTPADKRTDWVRTVVPVLWSTLIAWLIRVGVPESVTDTLNAVGAPVILPLTIAAVYGLLKAVETKMPPWLSKLLMGSQHEPEFPTKPDKQAA